MRLIDGVPMIRRVVESICRSKVREVLVVTGYQTAVIEEMLAGLDKVQFVHNDDYEKGMSTSIGKGVKDLGQIDRCMICLGDLPHLTTNDYDRLIEVFESEKSINRIIIPTFQGKRGHPVIFGESFFGDLEGLPISDEGARKIILNNEEYVLELELDHNGILKDIDFNTSD
ncbi:MAG: nucleotidyltransferase family protein [Saprospiraceae bacterium]|nr:nucleotidyltransferase family protein [Saprospiraceae bacterium]